MFSLAYTSSIIGTIGFGAFIVLEYYYRGRFFGRTLSQWIAHTSRKKDSISAEKLINVRKSLEVLAHDVLKHRILGIASLIQELQQITNNGKNIQALSDEQQTNYRNEIFRLCGIKLSPEERLWKRWIDAFVDIYKHTGKNTLVPPVDPMFANTVRELLRLRALIMAYVEKESSNTEFLNKIMHLRFDECVDVYPKVLELANASRMSIQPDEIVQKAINAVASQTKRSHFAENLTVYHTIDQKLFCSAAPQTLIMCLTRLIDNSLDCGNKTAIDVELCTDDFTGTSSILFKVYDLSKNIPDASSFGMGIRGIQQNIANFEGGLQFRSENRDDFKKAAIISFPASEFDELNVSKNKPLTFIVFSLLAVLTLAGFIFCLGYAIGGPPVEFAGKGSNIIEFSVSTGDELVIPLCSGGRNVRAEIKLANDACIADSCSFGRVLQELEPCSKSINDPMCPGEIRWIPQFGDGLRQGQNYELTIHCIAEGPPSSDDQQRIRVLVFRQNSTPRVLLTQLINITRGDVFHVLPGQTIKTGVIDNLTLRIMATDDDADIINYTLHQPDGTVLSSNDGTFTLHPVWSKFGTSTFELEVSDNISQNQKISILLEADELHPIELKKVALWDNDSTVRQICDGTSESRICHLPNHLSNVLEMQVWFDPLQQRIRPAINFETKESQGFEILPRFPLHSATSTPGDQWEIYSKTTHLLVGVIELTKIEQTQTPGLYNFTFTTLTSPAPSELNSIALNLSVSELSNRMPELKTILILTRSNDSRNAYLFSTRHIELTEYDKETDAEQAHANIWINPNLANRSSEHPSIDTITCITQEFSEFFEKPVISDHHNAWKLDFRLKNGCIPGLSQSTPGKSRLCAANIHFENEQNQSEVIWIMLNPRSCNPRLESLTLTSTREELANNQFKWNFHILDPDGDLPIQNIDLTGSAEYSIQIDSQSNQFGNTYEGTISMNATCDNPTFATQNSDIALRIVDNDKHEIIRPLTAQMNCPPLVSTPKSQTRFEVDEGTRLSIPLIHDEAVKLTLNNHFGTIQNDVFLWDATCLYGQGPHNIEIRAESEHKYGRPLMLEVSVLRCQPRFDITFDGSPLSPSSPVVLADLQAHHLKISPDNSNPNLKISAHINSEDPVIELAQPNEDNAWEYDIRCLQNDVTERIEFHISSADVENANDLSPIVLTVQCTNFEADSP